MLKQTIYDIRKAFAGTVVVCADDPSDFEKVNSFLSNHSKCPVNYYNDCGWKRCSTLDMDNWLAGRDSFIQQTGLSAPLSTQAITTHKHTHCPLEDALELAERFAWVLNEDEALTASLWDMWLSLRTAVAYWFRRTN